MIRQFLGCVNGDLLSMTRLQLAAIIAGNFAIGCLFHYAISHLRKR